MALLVGEGYKFGLDRGAVTGADAAYVAVVEGRLVEMGRKLGMSLGIGVDNPAGTLAQPPVHVGQEREFLRRVAVAALFLGEVETNRASVDAGRGTGLHPVHAESDGRKLLGDPLRGVFRDAAALRFNGTEMHQSVEESARRQYHLGGVELHAERGAHASYGMCRKVILRITSGGNEKQRGHRVLEQRETVRGVEDLPPAVGKPGPVALHARRPHSRSLRTVEHAELYRRLVGHNTHLATKSIYLSDYLPFCNTTDGRITRHLGHAVHILGHEQRCRAETRRSHSRLAAGMASPNNNHIEIESHISIVPEGKRLVFVSFHNLPFTRAFVVDAAEVEHAVDDHAEQLASVILAKAPGI